MADTFLIYDDEDQAKQASKDAWEQVLGGKDTPRAKRPEDVTEFLWGWRVGQDGRTAVNISERQDLEPESISEGEPQPPRPGNGDPPPPLPVKTDTLDEANWPPPSSVP